MSSNTSQTIKFNMDTVKKTFTCVVDDNLMSDPPLVEVTVCKIQDRKLTSNLVVELNKKHPLPALQHLKRVHNGEIIVSSSSELNLSSLNIDPTGLDLKSCRQIKVASSAPKTKKQYTKAYNLWPCGFHEDKYLEKLISNTLFTHKDMEEHCKWMSEAVGAAKRSENSVGALVVDPANKTVLAIAADDRVSHPMKHAVMVVVDLVARTQGGGVWPVRGADYIFGPNVHKQSITHAKRNLEQDVKKPDGPYLCTGYDLYVTREPCSMCAMALVHSRVRRVFYGCASEAGALGSQVKLHTLKGLNHRYEVFKNLLKEVCEDLYKNANK